MMHIILIIDLVMANTHPKSQSTKRLVVGLSREKNGKSKEIKTPCGKKLKVLPVSVGIVTCFRPDVMSKFHCSNKSKTLSLQLTSNVVSRVAKRLTFTGMHKVQCSHNSDPMKKNKNPVERRRCRDKNLRCQVINETNAK
jgi:hypothetical protein